MKNIVVGVDIGGSHVSAHLIDLDKRIEVGNSWVRNKLDSSADPEVIIELWASTIEASISSHPVAPQSIHIAIPGPMDYDTGICMINDQGKYGQMFGVNLKVLLSERLDYDINRLHMVNDAACFLKGELFGGSMRGITRAIGVTLGTGLGSSYSSHGSIIDADLWRMPFKGLIAEDFISTRWFVNRFRELSSIKIDNVEDLVSNHSKSPYFNVVFEEFSDNLSVFLYNFIRLKNPSAGVLGGNIIRAERHFFENTKARLNSLLGVDFPLRLSSLGEKAMTMGAGANGC